LDISPKVVFTARTSGDVLIFDIEGELSRRTSSIPTLSELVKTQLSLGKRQLLIDFEKARFVDSFGVGELIASYTSTQNRGGLFKVCRLPDSLLLVFMITQLDKVIKVYRTEKDALEAFADPIAPR